MCGAMEFCSGKSCHLEKDLTGIGQISRYVKTNIHPHFKPRNIADV